MNLGSILSCSELPNDLEKIINQKNYKKLNVFIDLKNVARGLFVKDIAEEIVINTKNMGTRMDSNIFQSLIYTASRWFKFARYKGLECNIYFCSDTGKSNYHKNINGNYKANRIIGYTTLGDLEEPLMDIRHKNFEIAEKVLNKIPRIYFFDLKYLESDFLPYYLITRKLDMSDSLNVICSNDKDHYQVLNIPHTLMYSRTLAGKRLYHKNSIISDYTKLGKKTPKNQIKKKEEFKTVDTNYISVMMSVCGDKVDCVDGIHGVGPVRAVALFKDKGLVEAIIGDLEKARDRVLNNGMLFNEIPVEDELWNKVLKENSIVTKAFKQIDYEMLIKTYEKKDTTEKSEALEYIDKILNKDKEKMINKFILLKYMNELPDKNINDYMVEGCF